MPNTNYLLLSIFRRLNQQYYISFRFKQKLILSYRWERPALFGLSNTPHLFQILPFPLLPLKARAYNFLSYHKWNYKSHFLYPFLYRTGYHPTYRSNTWPTDTFHHSIPSIAFRLPNLPLSRGAIYYTYLKCRPSLGRSSIKNITRLLWISCLWLIVIEVEGLFELWNRSVDLCIVSRIAIYKLNILRISALPGILEIKNSYLRLLKRPILERGKNKWAPYIFRVKFSILT